MDPKGRNKQGREEMMNIMNILSASAKDEPEMPQRPAETFEACRQSAQHTVKLKQYWGSSKQRQQQV